MSKKHEPAFPTFETDGYGSVFQGTNPHDGSTQWCSNPGGLTMFEFAVMTADVSANMWTKYCSSKKIDPSLLTFEETIMHVARIKIILAEALMNELDKTEI